MAPNAIDLTTVANVKTWAVQGPQGQSVTITDQDQTIQDAITAFSALVLRATGRGPQNGTVPATSPFVIPVTYDDVYDGSGTMRQPVRNWPITQGNFLKINGQTIPQSVNVNTWGWVVDADAKFVSLRGGYNASVATFQNYRYQGGWGGPNWGPGFQSGIQNIEWNYNAGFTGVPFDLEMCARKVVSLNYKRRSWIGQVSQAMSNGAGTVTFGSQEMDRDCLRVFQFYRAYRT